MSHRSSSSSRVRFFQPVLESLEERNLLSNTGYINLLDGLDKLTYQHLINAYQLQSVVNSDVKAFNAAPRDAGALLKLEMDSALMVQEFDQLIVLSSTISDLVLFGEAAGLVTNDYTSISSFPPIPASSFNSAIPGVSDTDHYDRLLESIQKILPTWQALVSDVEADMYAALFGFLSGTGGASQTPPLPMPSSPPSGTTPTGGGYGATYTDAPPSASASGPDITESAFITAAAGNDAPITATITYSATDGTSGGPVTKTIAPGASQTLSLTVMPCSAGVVGTWTVTIDGHVDHTNTTTFTP